MLTPGMFLLALVFGAAAIACWTSARFPALTPATGTKTVLHLAAAFGLMQVLPPIVDGAASTGLRELALTACFVAVLPATVYLCLSTLWVLRMVQGYAGGYR